MKKNIISLVVGLALFAISTFCVIDFSDTIEALLACLPLYIVGTILVYKSISNFLK